jgi:hypothetical protein
MARPVLAAPAEDLNCLLEEVASGNREAFRALYGLILSATKSAIFSLLIIPIT